MSWIDGRGSAFLRGSVQGGAAGGVRATQLLPGWILRGQMSTEGPLLSGPILQKRKLRPRGKEPAGGPAWEAPQPHGDACKAGTPMPLNG